MPQQKLKLIKKLTRTPEPVNPEIIQRSETPEAPEYMVINQYTGVPHPYAQYHPSMRLWLLFQYGLKVSPQYYGPYDLPWVENNRILYLGLLYQRVFLFSSYESVTQSMFYFCQYNNEKLIPINSINPTNYPQGTQELFTKSQKILFSMLNCSSEISKDVKDSRILLRWYPDFSYDLISCNKATKSPPVPGLSLG